MTKPVQRQLTSTAMVHTPSLFRAMQNDYAFRGAPRQRAIHMLSSVYGIAEDEARRLLSGSIKPEIDEEAGTVSYIISA